MAHFKTIRNLFQILALALLFTACGEKTITLEIVETSDIHGALFPIDFMTNKPVKHSMASVMTLIKEKRSNPDTEVVLLDNGDILQGQPVVYFSNFEKTDTLNIVPQVLNYMQYDAATLGNHDIETGHAVYDKVGQEMKMPWLAANAIDTKTGKPYFQPYTIIKKRGLKIAVLGLITPRIPDWLPENIWEGIEFEDMIESARKWVPIIQQKEKPDLLIGLFHAGVDYTYSGQDATTPKNENASVLVAEQVAGFDIIFTGHDHQNWNKLVENPEGKQVVVTGPQSSARSIPVVTVTCHRKSFFDDWEKELAVELVDGKELTPDPDYMTHFDGFIKKAQDYVNRPVSTLDSTIQTRDALFGCAPIMNLVHKVQFEITNADISLAAPTVMNTTLEAGDLFVRDMFRLYKYENLLYTMHLTGKEIKDYLEFSVANWFNTMKNANDHLLKFRTDKQGKIQFSERTNTPQLAEAYFNFDSAAGIDYTVDVSKPAGSRITITQMSNGDPFDLEKTYEVAVNSYRGNGGGGHLMRGAGLSKDEINARRIASTDKDLRYHMLEHFEWLRSVWPEPINNWKLIPEKWVQNGRERDMTLLFGKEQEQ